jgi:hypothetical protein
LKTLDDQGTFEEAPPVGRSMRTKFVFTTSLKNDFSVKYKARLVVCGYTQIKGIDYDETFSPTTPLMAIYILLSIGASKDREMALFDVKSAFLLGENDFEQYCLLPEGCIRGNRRVRIIKSLYGQKQAPKIWSDLLHTYLEELGFERCPVVPCLYCRNKGDRMKICVHVDDGLIVGKDLDKIKEFWEALKTKVKDGTFFYPLEKYLGMELKSDGTYVDVTQTQYIREMTGFNIGKADFKHAEIPMGPTIKLAVAQQDPTLKPILAEAGTLRYVADRSRPDVLVGVGEMSSNASPKPSQEHVKVGKSIIGYLKKTQSLGLRLGGEEGDKTLFAFTDASYETTGKCLSRLGGCLFLGKDSGAIYSFSKRDTTVSHSSTESEIKALDETIRAVVHARDILEFLGYDQINPTVIYADNKSMIDLCQTLKSTSNTRHINVRINYLRECVNKRLIKLVFVPTELNVADILTKPLARGIFERHRSKLLKGFGRKSPLHEESAMITEVNEWKDMDEVLRRENIVVNNTEVNREDTYF